jgi:hypothetical protein
MAFRCTPNAGSRASPRSVGAAAPLYCPRRRGACTSCGRRQRRPPLHVCHTLVRRHDWAPTLTVGAVEEAVSVVPLPRVHFVRYGGCLAPHRHLRGAITPTPRQQGVEEPEASSASPHWSWTRLPPAVPPAADLCGNFPSISPPDDVHS